MCCHLRARPAARAKEALRASRLVYRFVRPAAKFVAQSPAVGPLAGRALMAVPEAPGEMRDLLPAPQPAIDPS